MNDIKRECKRYNDNSNWRIIDDETIQYVDENTKMPMPLVCGFDERYFKENFYSKLINKCKDIPDEQCISGSDDHFCSLINGKCRFDIENITESIGDIYSDDIINDKDGEIEMAKITMDNNILADLDPRNVMTGRNDDFLISIVDANCSDQKNSIDAVAGDIDWENLNNIDDLPRDLNQNIKNYRYSCEKNIKFPRFNKSNFRMYNRQYNFPENLNFIQIDQQSRLDTSDSSVNVDFNAWDEDIRSSVLDQFQNNMKFKNCIDSKLNIHNDPRYEKFMDDVKNPNFKMNQSHLSFIKFACEQFLSLTPDEIKECIDKLEYSKVIEQNICNGDITATMIESYNLVLEFIGLNVNLDTIDEKYILEITPYIKQVLYKIITTSQYYEQVLCKGKTSKKTKNVIMMYNTLFDNKNSISYPFSDYKISFDWFEKFNEHFYGKVILLIFIGFIFAQIVKLFTMRGEALQK